MNSTNLWLFTELQNYIDEALESKEYFNKSTDFTRRCIFTFPVVFSLILDLPRKSLSVELFDSQEKINAILYRDKQGGKSAFCKARKKLNPSFFKDLTLHLAKEYYNKSEVKTWKGFILEAIDGSRLNILDTKLLCETFGVAQNQYSEVAQGRMMIGYDVLNGLILHCNLGHLSIGEGTVVKDWMGEQSIARLKIYDRNFAGLALQYLHDDQNISYVTRCKIGHNNKVKEFVRSGEKEAIQQWELNNKVIKELKALGIEAETTITVRLIRIVLDNGEVEILLTNLLDEQIYPHSCFQELYNLRWGVETVIDFLKNVLQIEISSGQSEQTILQDFFASILRANLQTLIEMDAQSIIEEKTKERKHSYQVNRNVACGLLKNRLHNLVLIPVCEKYYLFLVQSISAYVEPIRKNRNFPRNEKRSNIRGKYRTLNNYKRAI